MIRKLKQFEDSGWGVVTRYALIVLMFAAVAFMDSRYVSHDQVKEKEEQLHKIRSDDITMLLERMKEISRQAQSNAALNASVDNRLNRIEAQTEIILKYIQRNGDHN